MDDTVAQNMLNIGSSQSVGATEPPLLAIEGISKAFGRVCAVDNVALSIPGGQFVGVIGRSGAGKSTLLRLLNRLTEPSGGRVLSRRSPCALERSEFTSRERSPSASRPSKSSPGLAGWSTSLD